MCWQESEREKVRQLVSGQVEPVLSCLAGGTNKLAASMKRAMLEVWPLSCGLRSFTMSIDEGVKN
jgi:hypothetical protein